MRLSTAGVKIRDPASYRDPAGFVFRENGSVYRQVSRRYAAEYDTLIDSGLYHELVDARLLLPHEEADQATEEFSAAHRILRPVQLPFISYPYEWCFSQLRDSALATLEIQRRAMTRGMSLKDASAFNLQLFDGRPTLIDTLSFERYETGRPWVAYRQFCEYFLAPLALASYTDASLTRLSQIYLDGIPLNLASRLLPWRSKFNFSLAVHIHAHARMQIKFAAGRACPSKAVRLSERAFKLLLANLAATIASLRWRPPRSLWSDYYATNHNYGANGLAEKERLVWELIASVQPATVWELGANDGRFGRIAAHCGAQTVVSCDIDPACVEQNYRRMVDHKETGIHPLVINLTNPSASVGWANRERSSLDERGPADLVLALALVHHLAIGGNVPLESIMEYFARLGTWALVEWVPKDDSQVQRMLSGRTDIFENYTQPQFETAMRACFDVVRRTGIPGTKRMLYLLKRVKAPALYHPKSIAA